MTGRRRRATQRARPHADQGPALPADSNDPASVRGSARAAASTPEVGIQWAGQIHFVASRGSLSGVENALPDGFAMISERYEESCSTLTKSTTDSIILSNQNFVFEQYASLKPCRLNSYEISEPYFLLADGLRHCRPFWIRLQSNAAINTVGDFHSVVTKRDQNRHHDRDGDRHRAACRRFASDGLGTD